MFHVGGWTDRQTAELFHMDGWMDRQADMTKLESLFTILQMSLKRGVRRGHTKLTTETQLLRIVGGERKKKRERPPLGL